MAGRPTKYKPQFAKEVEKLAMLGLTDIQLAEYFEISEKSINTWKKQYPEFLQSLKDGRVTADIKVVESLYKQALKGNTIASIYWINNRCRAYGWSAKQNSDPDQGRNVNIQMNFITNNDCRPLQLPNTIDIEAEE